MDGAGGLDQQNLRECVQRRLTALRNELESQGWKSHWREINELVSPRSGRWLVMDRNRGAKKHNRIINSTASQSSKRLAAGMMAGITSPGRPWFTLTVPEPALADQADVKEWLHVNTQRMRDVFARSNLYNVLPPLYRELGDYGVGCMLALEDDDEVVRFYPFTIGSFYLAADDKFRVNTFYREFEMTVAQVVQRWGTDGCSERTKSLYQSKQLDAMISVVHAIQPNFWRETGRRDNRNLPFVSIYFEAGAEEDRLLSRSGFEEFPVLAPRWETIGEDVYGSNCPGMEALGDVKQLQHQELRKGEVIDKIARPPMTAPSSLKNRTASQLPGDITYVDVSQGQNGFQPVYTPNPQAIMALHEDIESVSQRIKSAYFEDLFLMLANDSRSGITAREIEERHQEKLLMLGPVLERLNDELLDPLIDRVFAIMLRRGLITQPPEALEGVDLKVEYVSILAQAQKAIDLTGIERLTTFVGSVSAIYPAAAKKLKPLELVDAYADRLGTPPQILATNDQAEAEILAQQQQAAAAQMMAAIQPAADAAKKLSEANVEGDNALTRLVGAT